MRLCPCGSFWGPDWDHEPGCKLWPGSEWDRDHAGFECPPQELQDVAVWAFEQGHRWRAAEDVSPSLREKVLREQIAQEVLDAGRGSWRNLAWMYPEQAAAVVLRLDAAVCDDHRLARSAVADVLARSTSDVSPSVAGEGPGRGPATSGNNTTVGENR